MKDTYKTKKQLIEEIEALRQEVVELKKGETERKKVEPSLKSREQEIRLIAENVPGLFSYIDADGCYRFINKQYEVWFGAPQTEIIGKHYSQVLGEITYELIKDSVEAALSGQKVYFEKCLPYVHGGERWVSANYVPDIDELGKVKGFFALVTDITEHKRAEARLLEEKKYSETLINSIPEIFYLIDENGRILKWNKNAEIITGYSAEEISKMGPLDFFVDGDKSLVEKAIHDVFTKGESTTEAHLISKEGNEVLYLFTGRLLTLGNQTIL